MVSRILKIPLEHPASSYLAKRYGYLSNAAYIDLLDFEVYTLLLANPHRLTDFIPQNYKGWIIINEVQRIPALLNEVHQTHRTR